MVTLSPNPRHRARFGIGAWLGARRALRSQDGFLLIEVLISALLLGLVAAATVTGLQAVDDNSTNQRDHNEAVEIAAQSQEELRSSPVSALEKLLTSPHVYSQTVDQTKYTITQEVHEINVKEENTTCTLVEHGSYTAPNFRVSSKVNWPSLKGSKPVVESSIITPPTSSSLEVDVGNAPSPTAGVAEVGVVATYAAFETGTPLRLEGTTGPQGCVFFTGIRATSAVVEIVEKSKFVTPTGALKVTSSEVSIAPGLTTRDQVIYDEGGAIAANFTYKGKSEYAGKKVTGDTFIVSNNEIGVAPELEVGTAGSFAYESGGEEHYTPHTGTYAVSGLTAKGGRYERGDLFPFPTAWTVFAGDCAANNPSTVTKGSVVPGEGTVTPGNTTAVSTPTSFLGVEALQGTEKSPTKALDSETLPVKITNLSCSTASPTPATPNNAATVSYEHTQHLSGGTLEAPFQPFGTFELCVQVVESVSEPSKDRVDRYHYENVNAEGAHFNLYPQELTLANEKKAREELEEKSAKRVTRVNEEKTQQEEREKEAVSKPKREEEEKALKKAGETEASNKVKRESEETANKKTWEEEEKAKFGKKITKAEREKKEKEQTEVRTKDVAAETAAKAKREEEEKALTKTAEKEASAKKTREEKEKATGETRTKETEAATKANTEEEEKATAKEKLAAEGKAQKVESGSAAKC
jgi:type II secretory pathway pseudopilin PulG